MRDIPQRTKLTIIGIVVFCMILYVAIDPANPKIPWFVGVYGSVLIIWILGNLFPRIREKLEPFYRPFLLILGVGGLAGIFIYIIYSSINGSFGTDSFLIVFVPVIVLVLPFFLIFYLGPLLTKLGKLKAAENLYSFMIRINHKFGLGYLQRGSLRHAQGDVDNALADYDRALEIAKAKLRHKPYFSNNYGSAMIYANKADIYLYKHDPQQAILECNMGLALNEKQPVADLMLKNRRGYAQLVSANYDGALQDFNSIRFEGKTAAYEKGWAANLYALKALALVGLARMDEAKSLWQMAVSFDPNYTKPDWLRESWKWPENLLTLANELQNS